MIVVVVEADFAPGDHARVLRQTVQLGIMRVCGMLRLVRVNSDGGVDPVVRLGVGHRRAELFDFGAVADGQDRARLPPLAPRSSMASRSASKSETSTCACESIRSMEC